MGLDSGVEGNRMPLVILWRLLRKHCTCCDIQAVCFHPVRQVIIGEEEDWGRREMLLEPIEGLLFMSSPRSLRILLRELE
jgi:hypothetical protein